MAFNQPTTTPTRERPTNESNGTHHFPRNPPPPTTQTTLHNSAIRFHCDPQHQPLWNDSLFGRECLAIQMPFCLLVRLCSKKKVEGKKRGKTRKAMCFFKKFIQFKTHAHHANFPLPLPPIAVSFKIIKIITAT